MKKKIKHETLFKTAIKHSDKKTHFLFFILALVSLLSASITIFIPFLEKKVLDEGNISTDNALLSVYLVLVVLFIVLILVANLINIRILYTIRHTFELELIHALGEKNPTLIKEKGAGAYSSSIQGDSDQVATMIAANWFYLIFSAIGAIISMVISALWYLPFTLIAVDAYLLIVLTVFIANSIKTKAYREGKEESYYLAPLLLEIAEENDEIQCYRDILDFENRHEQHFNRRDNKQEKADRSDVICKYLVSGIQSLSVCILLFVSIKDIKSNVLPLETLVALVAYFETIFIPTGYLSSCVGDLMRFHAFYDRISNITEAEHKTMIPNSIDICFDNATMTGKNNVVIRNISFDLTESIALVSLSGEEEQLFIQCLKGKIKCTDGNILLGNRKVDETNKHLILSLVTFFPELKDIFEQDLEFNITLGKKLISEVEYYRLLDEYELKSASALSDIKKAKEITDSNEFIIKDIYDFLPTELRREDLRKEVIDSICEADEKFLVENMCPILFARKYAIKERYDSLISKLGIESLQDVDFGIRGSNISDQNKVLIQCARFLLPIEKNPFVIKHPLHHLKNDKKKEVIDIMTEYIGDRKGIFLCKHIEDAEGLANKIVDMKKEN